MVKKHHERLTFDAPKVLAVAIRSMAKNDGVSMADTIRSLLRKSLQLVRDSK